jgi:hypothetical protein
MLYLIVLDAVQCKFLVFMELYSRVAASALPSILTLA